MAQGNYDHPSYLTRQQVVLGPTLAGASGTSAVTVFNSNMRIRQVVGCVQVAGTAAQALSILFSGTTALGTINWGTSVAVQSIGTIGDLNTTVTAGTVVSVKNGADATCTARLTLECYIDPAASWTGNGN
jgi:hypothetical protein